METPRIWFITGALSGFGRYLTELVLRNGEIAIATLYDPSAPSGSSALADLQALYPPDKLLVLNLDVSKPQQVVDAFVEAQTTFGRIDVVFNNAGYSMMSEVEGAPESAARAMFDVNFWGAANVSREAIRFFRDVNQPIGGRLLQVSSAGGIQAYSAIGHYSASKFAIEGLTEALAVELRPEWNIKITLIELGGFKTNAGQNMLRVPTHPAYIDPVTQSHTARSYLMINPAVPSDPIKGVNAIYRLAGIPNPPLRLPLGKDALGMVRKKGEDLIAAAELSTSFSEGLEITADAEQSRL
ncbi:NAD(P)-binding protein [Wolfiporia cocos MD-104 SS10]|uniref:NAD(P)-binding protein n=1 Tax=Wolfiporia cocos (strain MD-104) TaxID=742152 RepID=A0A2H3JMS1_WOLCO|nr:NAD(P)-binding protein [Wolfiporia cocos MD-104 SS10]